MSSTLKVSSFFAGIGGFDLGLENVGMEVVFQCEKNSFCQQVLKEHWSDVPLFSDINTVQPEDIPPSQVWCGGFPCQDLSLANQGKRKGLKGERSGLFHKFAEHISKRRPRWIIIENVPGLLNSHGGQDFKVLLQKLDEFGYGISWRVLDAKYFGTPQRRRRVYIVASYRTLLSAEVLFERGGITVTEKQGVGKRKVASGRFGENNRQSTLYSIQHAGIGRKHTAGPQAKGYRNDGETYTLDSRGTSDAIGQANASFGMRGASGVSQGLDGNRFRAIGNAVAVPIVEWIGERLLKVNNRYYKT